MLSISNLTYRIAGRLIFEDAAATIQENWKVGLVGANGAGKSTLFKLIAGELHADGGEIALSSRYTMGMVRQDLRHDETPLLDLVLEADTRRTALLKEAETEEDAYRLTEIYTQLGDIDAYAAPARAASILAGLGFTEENMSQPISSFSGGWRMRVALAAALFQQPDFLLLDEPTNHLDLEAVMWLEKYLMTYPNTVIIISHDRELLNKCVDHVVHVENRKLVSYTGNYDSFEKERAEKRMNQQKLHERTKAQREHMQAFVERFRAKASKARQAQSRLKALEKMDVVDAVMADRSTRFTFPKPEELPPPVIALDHVSVGYAPGNPILTNVHERIDLDDRIALLGANGNGKSTLIKMIADRLPPEKGEVFRSPKLRIGYFSQHQADELDMDDSPYVAMLRIMQKPEAAVRAKLGQFGFGKELADNRIGNLSGGEKARLLFAMISHHAPHLLLLDEPTNHLDMDAREALVQALNQFEGAVMIVSHDPSMVERVADRLWLVADGGCHPFEGDLDAYREHVMRQRRQEKKDQKNSTKSEPEASSGLSKQELKQKRKQFPELASALEKAEKAMSRLESKKRQLENQLADPDFLKDNTQVQEAQHAHGRLLRDIEEAEATWVAAQEAFDRAGQ